MNTETHTTTELKTFRKIRISKTAKNQP